MPTFLGFIAICILLICFSFLAIKNIAFFLSKQAPVERGFLVVEGWLDSAALLAAINVYKSGKYQYMVTTGGSINVTHKSEFDNYAEASAAVMLKKGIDKSELIVLPTPDSAQNRTFLSAVIVRDWLLDNHISNRYLDVFSADVHARRTHILYKMALGAEYNIGIIAANPSEFDLQYWWRTSVGAKSVVTELVGLLWVQCCFNPGKYRSHQEKWGGTSIANPNYSVFKFS